jgi:protein TonB
VKLFPVSLLAGGIISLMLFWLMQFMISNNQQAMVKSKSLHMTEFVRLKKETHLQAKDRTIPDPPKPEDKPPPPRPMPVQSVQANPVASPQMDIPNLDIPLQTEAFSGSALTGVQIGTGGISTNVIPLVRIPPRYPSRAASRRIEGWVKIEFTITEEGTVKDAVVVDSHPKNIFDQAALSAIKRWKFKAKIIGGEAFEQRALQVLQFKLAQ